MENNMVIIDVEKKKVLAALSQIRTAKDCIVKVATEMNDVVYFIAEACKDGIVTDREKDKLVKEINDGLAVLSALKALILKGAIRDCLFVGSSKKVNRIACAN